eukprot:COSAG05_NODE_3756_length_1855_cov_1.857631_1_plen_416_part_00
MEQLFKLSQGSLAKMARQQEETGRTAPAPKSGRLDIWKANPVVMRAKMKRLLKQGAKGVKGGTGARWLAKKMGRSYGWTLKWRKKEFKRFTVRWKLVLSADNIAKRLARSKKRVAWYNTHPPLFDPQHPELTDNIVEIHCDEKWFFRGAPKAIWADADEPPEFRHAPRVAKAQREKVMFLAVTTNCPGRAKLAMIPCQKRVAAKRDSKNRPKGTMEYKDRAVTSLIRLSFATTVAGRWRSRAEKSMLGGTSASGRSAWFGEAGLPGAAPSPSTKAAAVAAEAAPVAAAAVAAGHCLRICCFLSTYSVAPVPENVARQCLAVSLSPPTCPSSLTPAHMGASGLTGPPFSRRVDARHHASPPAASAVVRWLIPVRAAVSTRSSSSLLYTLSLLSQRPSRSSAAAWRSHSHAAWCAWV